MGTTFRIVILDDSAEDAELLERELDRGGIAFTAQRLDKQDAFLAALRDFAPDIVLSDYSLPGLDGMDVLRLVRQKAPDVPVIIVTDSIDQSFSSCRSKMVLAWRAVVPSDSDPRSMGA